MASSSLTISEADVKCCLCLDVCRDAVETPCGHLMCEACAADFSVRARRVRSTACPVCRTPLDHSHMFQPSAYIRRAIASMVRICPVCNQNVRILDNHDIRYCALSNAVLESQLSVTPEGTTCDMPTFADRLNIVHTLADRGVTKYQTEYGEIMAFSYGQTNARSRSTGITYLNKAASAGDVRAIESLVTCYYKFEGNEQLCLENAFKCIALRLLQHSQNFQHSQDSSGDHTYFIHSIAANIATQTFLYGPIPNQDYIDVMREFIATTKRVLDESPNSSSLRNVDCEIWHNFGKIIQSQVLVGDHDGQQDVDEQLGTWIYWFTLAGQHSNIECIRALAKYYFEIAINPSHPEHSPDIIRLAHNWIDNACDVNDPFGWYGRGRLYETGVGVPANKAMAFLYYTRAASADKKARDALYDRYNTEYRSRDINRGQVVIGSLANDIRAQLDALVALEDAPGLMV